MPESQCTYCQRAFIHNGEYKKYCSSCLLIPQTMAYCRYLKKKLQYAEEKAVFYKTYSITFSLATLVGIIYYKLINLIA